MTGIKSLRAGAATIVLLAVVQAASAQSQDTQRIGEQTRAWLDLQAGGTQASAAERPVTGELAERVYQRYLDSFTHPIPEQFSRESFTSDGED